MELIKVEIKDADRLAPLVAAFRTQLRSYKGIKSQPILKQEKKKLSNFWNLVFRYMPLKIMDLSQAILSAE